jgi:epoxyqueuosine reductase QueG
MDLTQTLTEMAKGAGASLTGVAPVERFAGAPRGHHPQDLLPGAQSVFIFGMRILDRVMEWPSLLRESEFYPPEIRIEALRTMFYRKSGYDIINDQLSAIALRLATHLEEAGYPSLFFPTTNAGLPEHLMSYPAIFSQRHAAVRAGLGEFGLNNVVVTARYGPRIRWNSVITTVALAPSPLLSAKTCEGVGCQKCVDECPAHALRLLPEAETDRLWLDPAARTDWAACRKSQATSDCMGRCIRVCPAGRGTQSAAVTRQSA